MLHELFKTHYKSNIFRKILSHASKHLLNISSVSDLIAAMSACMVYCTIKVFFSGTGVSHHKQF